jgi:hypothetical protein
MSIETRSDTSNVKPQRIVRFVLKEALTAGGNAEAYVRICRDDGTFYNTTTPITVYDETGGRDGVEGDKGVAVWMPDSRHYEIIDKVC